MVGCGSILQTWQPGNHATAAIVRYKFCNFSFATVLYMIILFLCIPLCVAGGGPGSVAVADRTGAELLSFHHRRHHCTGDSGQNMSEQGYGHEAIDAQTF